MNNMNYENRQGISALYGDIESALRIRQADPRGSHQPDFYFFKTGRGYETLSVCVREGEPRLSNNGGDYYEDVRFFVGAGGSVCSYSISSYEDADPQDWVNYGVALDLVGLTRLAELAAKRILAEMAPPKVDIGKVRRRVEDALRKTGKEEDILAVAGLLGVKLS